MSSTQLLKETIKNNPDTFETIQNSFNQILFVIISYGKDDEFSIPLISSIIKEPKISIRVNEREETFFEIKLSYNYDILYSEGILDEDSIENFFYSYSESLHSFYDELEISIYTYLDALYQGIELAEIREIINPYLIEIRDAHQTILDLVKPHIKKTPQVSSQEEIEGFFTDFTNQYFHFEVNEPNNTSLHSVCIDLNADNNKKKSFLIQLGDFLIYNEFLMIPSKDSSRKFRTRLLESIKNQQLTDIEFISKIYPVFKIKSDEIKSISIDFGSYRETFEEGDSFLIEGEDYKISKLYIPKYIPTNSIQITGHYKTTPDIIETYFISLESFINCDKRFNEFISKIPAYSFNKEGLANILKEAYSISFINDPLLSILVKGFSPIDYDQVLAKGQQYILAITPDYENKVRIKLLVRNIDHLEISEIKNDKELNKAQSYSFQLYIPLSLESKNFYIYDPLEEYYFLDSYSSESKIPECIVPFILEHYPQFDQSIVYIKRVDGHPFDLNDRYVLNQFFFVEIPKSNVKHISKHLNKRTQEVIEFLRDLENNLDEFGILYDIQLSNKQIENLKNLLQKSFSDYSENNDIRKEIIDGFSQELSDRKFIDESTGEIYESKFYINNTYFKSKGINEYRIFIDFNFFSMDTETLIIKYSLGAKFFYVDLQTDNITHKNDYMNEFKKKLRDSSIFSEKSRALISLEEIKKFVDDLENSIYAYTPDRSNNSIDIDVNSIIIISEYSDNSGNLLRRSDTFFIGDLASKLSLFYAKKRSSSQIIDLIHIKKNYNTNEVVEVYLHYGNTGLTLKLSGIRNDYKIVKLRLFDSRKSIELEDTQYYKSVDKINVKMGKSLGDPDGEYYEMTVRKEIGFPESLIPEKATGDILNIIKGLSTGVIDSIKLHFEGNEIIINTNQGKYLFKEREIIRVFVSDLFQEISALPSVESDYYPYCLGISIDLDKLTEVDSALVMFLQEDGNLEQVFFGKGSANSEVSLIDKEGEIDSLLMSEDDLKLRVIIDGKQHNFQVDESIIYDIFKRNGKGYKKIASNLPIFMIYRNEIMIEQTNFDKVSDFSINDIEVIPYIDSIGIWDDSASLETEVLKFISTLPPLDPVSEVLYPKIEEEKEEQPIEIEEELTFQLEQEQPVEIIEELPEIVEEEAKLSKEDEIRIVWNRFTVEQREILLKRLGFEKSMPIIRFEKECKNDWEDFSYKGKLLRQYEEAIQIINELKTINLSLNFTFDQVWEDSDTSQRVEFLKNLGIDENKIDLHKNDLWEYIENSEFGDALIEALLEGLAAGTMGTESHFDKVYVKIEILKDNNIIIRGIEAGQTAKVLLQDLGRRQIEERETIRFVLLNKEINKLDVYTFLDNRYKHRILFKTGEDIIIHNLKEKGSFLSVKLRTGYKCNGISLITLDETKLDTTLDEIQPQEKKIYIQSIKDVEGLWKMVLSEKEKKGMVEIFDVFKPYSEVFKTLSWESPELEYFIESINNPDSFHKIDDWYREIAKEIQEVKSEKKVNDDILMLESTILLLFDVLRYLSRIDGKEDDTLNFLKSIGFNDDDANRFVYYPQHPFDVESVFQKDRGNLIALKDYIKENIDNLSWNRWIWEQNFRAGDIVEAREKGRMIIGEVVRVNKNKMTNDKSVRVKPIGIYAKKYPGVNFFTVKKMMSTDGELVKDWGRTNTLLPLTREELSLWQQGEDLTQIHKNREQKTIKSITDVEKFYEKDYKESILDLINKIEGKISKTSENWESKIEIDNNIIQAIPEGRVFTPEEIEFFQSLYDKIGIECNIIENSEINCSRMTKEQESELLKYIKNFYEYL
ncbi:MAG: hypothetical protein ACFFDB_00165 [Promethearchaeota archaeon]